MNDSDTDLTSYLNNFQMQQMLRYYTLRKLQVKSWTQCMRLEGEKIYIETPSLYAVS